MPNNTVTKLSIITNDMKKILKNILIFCFIGLIFGSCTKLILNSWDSCIDRIKKGLFISKYKNAEFSDFKEDTHVFIRGYSRQNPILMISSPSLVYDTTEVGIYFVIMDIKSERIIKTGWTLTDSIVNADTLVLQKMARVFMKYDIPRLDKKENVYIYLKDAETLALVKCNNPNEIKERYPEIKWRKIIDKWYEPN